MLHPLNHGPNPNIPQLCSHCYPFSYNDCSRRVWTSRKDLFKKYGEIFEMFIEKMMVNPPYTWDASLFGPSQNRMQSSWPALQRRGLHTPWPCLPGMRSRRGCMRLKKITLITSCNCISFTKCKAKLRQKINHMIKIYIIWLRPTRIYIYIYGNKFCWRQTRKSLEWPLWELLHSCQKSNGQGPTNDYGSWPSILKWTLDKP